MKFAIDFETYQIGDWREPSKGEVISKAYAVGIQPIKDFIDLKKEDIVLFLKKKEEDEPLRELFQYLVSFKERVDLYFFNAGYDFDYLLQYCETELRKTFPHLKIEASHCKCNDHGLESTISIHKTIKITVHCLGIFNKAKSLAGAGELVKLKKGTLEEDYLKGNFNGRRYINEFGEEKEIDGILEKEYLKTDVLITAKYYGYVANLKKELLKIFESYDRYSEKKYNRKQILKSTTLPSLIKKGIANVVGDEFDFTKEIEDIYTYKLIDNSFIAGFCCLNKNVNRLYSEEKKIKYFDINSMYPYIMTMDLPYGDLLDDKPEGKYVAGLRLKIEHIEYLEKYSFLSTKPLRSVLHKRLAEGDIVEILILKNYGDLIEKMCNVKYEVIETYYQKATNVLAPFFRYLYDFRLRVKSERDKYSKGTNEYEVLDGKQDTIKLLMNSVYGKWCELRHKGLENGDSTKFDGVGDGKDGELLSRLTGLFVCTTGRVITLSTVKKIIDKGNTFLYCDTDSVQYEEKYPIDIPVDKEKLGYGKTEGMFNLYLSLGDRKKYCLINNDAGEKRKFACGGVQKHYIWKLKREDLERFYDINNATLIPNVKKVAVKNQNGIRFRRIYNTDITINDKAKNRQVLVFDSKGYHWR